MIHRHLDYSADTPVTAIGDDALDDLLSRGDLLDWQPLLRLIAADPHGELASRVTRLLDANPRYGTGSLWRAWIAHRKSFAGADVPEMSLGALRRRRGLSQSELAAVIGMTQSDLSKAERRQDWHVSTLRTIVAGLGWNLTLTIVDSDGRSIAELRPEPEFK
jgi:hypothetical protein